MKRIIMMTALAVQFGVVPCWAASNEDLAAQVGELIEQNRVLLERVAALEERVAGQAQPAGAASPQEQRKESEAGSDTAKQEGEEQSLARMINDRVELGGLVEVEAVTEEDFADEESSDVSLATVELSFDARISDWSSAHLLLLYEEGEEDNHVIVDEGTITLGNEEEFPVVLTAGKMYLPFGLYESNMVSDTLPLEIGEINDTAVLAGFRLAGLRGGVHVFNGDVNEAGESDRIESWGASVGYSYEGETFSLETGLDWLSNIGDTNGLGDYLEENTGAAEMAEYVDGLGAHLLLQYGPFALIAEYIGALDEFAAAEIAFAGSGAQPEAWSLEAGWTFDLLQRETVFSVSWQGTAEAQALGLPEDRYLAAIRMMILANTSLAIEYRHDEDYASADDGTGESSDAAALQLAVEF
ncbi:MAG TPA: hypothetical protein DDY20_10580 [Desulfobulbaceae bacterium]|nr:hypothetical protein [Desulfobulbaceae bacterium]